MAAKYDYKGIKITGDDTTAKVFKNSGVKKAKKKDLYFNTDTGHVYKCTKGGNASEAKWKYIRTDIAKKPSKTVSGLCKPVRQSGNRKMKCEWKVPAALTDKKKGDRAEKLYVYWYLGIDGTDPKYLEKDGPATTSDTIDLNNLQIGKKKYTRESFYPLKGKPKLSYVTCKVVPHNSKGNTTAKPEAKQTRNFEKPKAPTISGFSFDTETGTVSWSINTDAGAGYQERYDTMYWVKVLNTRVSNKETTWKNNETTKSTSLPLSYDATDYQQLDYNQYIKITCQAWARGFWGDSDKTEVATYYLSYPGEPKITKVSYTGKSKDKNAKDKATIHLTTGHTTAHPVDRIKLEYLANCEYASKNRIPADADWKTTDIIDNAQCTAMSMPVADLVPDAGKYTWVRLKTYHANEAVLYRYSEPERLKDLETPAPTAADDEITIIDAVAGENGESAVVTVAWNADGTDDSTGTELSWSDEEDTWESTEEPKRYEFEWSKGKPITHEGVTYQDHAIITIKGLAQSTTYFIKARRYLDGDTTSYGPYSNPKTVLTSEIPDTVVAQCARFIPTGKSLPVTWTFSGSGIQTAWQIVKVGVTYELTEDTFVVASKVYYERHGSGTEADPYWFSAIADPQTVSIGSYYEATLTESNVIAEGEGSLGSTQIDASKLAAHADDGAISFVVKASTGSKWAVSSHCSVEIQDKPELALDVADTLTAQPLSFGATSSSISDLVVIVTAQGATGQTPRGVMIQTGGDTVHSNVYTPVWWPSDAVMELTSDAAINPQKTYYVTDEEGPYYIGGAAYSEVTTPIAEDIGTYYEMQTGTGDVPLATRITLPPELSFWDLGRYTIRVTAKDRITELSSEPVEKSFAVLWSHQAPSIVPTATYTVTEDTEVNEDRNYYTYEEETQSYVVVEAEGGENPHDLGWLDQNVTEYVTLTPIDTTDENGMHHQAVQISLTPPPDAVETDYYDIYRLTGDGARLIGESFPLTYVAQDEYAPFGDNLTHYYRIATRTADGDESFMDIEYVLDGAAMRFDWAGGSLELPYNIEIGDSYKKDVDIRAHLDGGVDGYWRSNIERKASLNSDVIRLTQTEEVALARALGRYTGPVFVRTPDGSAYEADVQVKDLSIENSAIVAVAIDATEIDLTDEFMLPTPYKREEESE